MRCSNAGMSSSISRICTWRCTFTLGARRSRTDVITPNSPYPPIASRNSSAFSSRLQVRDPVGVDQHERLDVSDDRLKAQAAAVGVRRQCTPDAQTVRSGLLLADAPRPRGPLLHVHQIAHQLGPLDSRLDVDQTAGGVEAEHPL